MNDKNICYEEKDTKHKKKSKSKGMKRSDHKHQYEDVLMTYDYHHTDFLTGKPKVDQYQGVTTVCTICGYVGDAVKDRSKYYDKVQVENFKNVYREVLNEKAMKLPKWRKDLWDKFAVKE
jgi:hypothetical protein